MPTRNLPNNPSLENFKNQAKTLQRLVRAGDSGARELVQEFHPRETDPAMFARADAQLVLARQHGFASWARLRSHLETVARYTWRPVVEPGPTDTREQRIDEFVRQACLTYTADEPGRIETARGLLATDPTLAQTSIHAAVTAGDTDATSRFLAADPSLAGAQGGPYNWEPLMYATYTRLGPTLEVARLLLAHGADPNVGYLWEGFPSPFTALTGAFGWGEGAQAPHHEWAALARLLLEAGADANDSQALYNRSLVDWEDDTPDHLELLLEFGLGHGDGGPWHRRMGFTHPSPPELLEDELLKAANKNWPRWAGLVVDAGVDVNGLGTRHPTLEGDTAWELAVRNGNDAVVAVLDGAGARPAAPDPAIEFLGACMKADRAAVEATRSGAAAAIARRPHHIATAAERGRTDSVRLMAEVGFDVNVIEVSWPHRPTPLHRAASNGHVDTVTALLELGADRTIRDCTFNGTAAGWAEHSGYDDLARLLAT